MKDFMSIAHCVHDLRPFVENGPILQTLKANYSQLGWNMKYGTDLSRAHDYRDTINNLQVMECMVNGMKSTAFLSTKSTVDF